MLVSCVCPTMAGREKWLARAIGCFRHQTAHPKELIIVADDDVAIDSNLFFPEDAIRVVYVRKGLTVGDKRNIGAEYAKGIFIASHDDDDYYGPERLRDQIVRLILLNKDVTSYRNIVFADGKNAWMNTNWPGGYGATLCYRREWWVQHPFPEVNVGEDWAFVEAAMQAKQFTVGDANGHFRATIHDGNTAKRTIGAGWLPLQS